MSEWLYLKDMYGIVLTDVNNLPESHTLQGEKLSSLLSHKLSSQYKGLRCFFHETDCEHHGEYFLSEIEDVYFVVGKDGLQIHVKFKGEGRFTNGYDKTFYQLVENKIDRKKFNSLLAKKLQKLGTPHTYTEEPEIELLPEKDLDREGDLIVQMFLIQDSQNLLKAQSQ